MSAVWLTGLRDRVEIERAYRPTLDAAPHIRGLPFVEGLAAGYGWLLGEIPTSPAWGRPGAPVALEQVRVEAAAAEAAAWRRRSITAPNMDRRTDNPPPRLDRDYALGTARALDWATGQLAGPAPWPSSRDTLRAPVEIAAAASSAAVVLADDDRHFREGAMAAYAWLMGQASAPFTGAAGALTPRLVRAEAEAAESVIYRRPGAADVPQRWAIGAQHALMWAHHASTTAPGFDDAIAA